MTNSSVLIIFAETPILPTVKAKKTKQYDIIIDDFQFDLNREREYILARYKDKEAILSQLREISANSRTYQFLGELFFQTTMNELENHMPSDEWINQLKEVRNDIYILFELAQAARILQIQ